MWKSNRSRSKLSIVIQCEHLIFTVANKGKAQLNIELDTQQSFVIQNNFSRNTTIFRDTTAFHDAKLNFTKHNKNFEDW